MTDPVLLWLVGGSIVIAWVAVAQMRTRIVRPHPSVAAVVARWVLIAYGVVLIALVLRSQQSVPGVVIGMLLAVLAVLSVGLGIARGFLTRIWIGESGQAFRRGGVAVLVLWGISLVAHLGVDEMIDRSVPGLGPTTMLAYIVVTIAAQNVTVRRRASAQTRARPR